VLEPNIEYTAAHPYVPFGTDLYVCYASCVWVEVTDRGPYVGGRDLDLSYAAAEEIRLTGVGVGLVYVDPASARELAASSQLGYLTLINPSRWVLASIEAFGLGEWITFRPDTDREEPPVVSEAPF
jgi:hypothetical protein